MIATLGNIGLITAFALALLQTYPSNWRNHSLTLLTSGSLWFAMGCLVWGYVVSDFSIENVFLNSHPAKPLLYKITGSWGNHEGSMLLLNAILSCYGVALVYKKTAHQAAVLRWFYGIFSGFLAFSLFLSNPFEILSPAPEVGQGLNPLLQDIGLAMHPPILYTGYVGFSVVFAYTIVHLYHSKINKNWASIIRPWVFFSWGFLTLGIGLGSWWAYRELGWGGFWFWDPVENASLLPWLAATALVHSLIVLEKRQHLPHWTALLAILTFSLCLVGIFLVRSGILTSVHSFALDPKRGIYFLIFLALTLCGSCALLVAKAGSLTQKTKPFSFLSKETCILLNNLFLTVLCFTVLLGILYPLLIELIYQTTLSVGSGFYNTSFNILAFPLLALLCIAPYLKWKQETHIRSHIIKLLPATLIIIVYCFIIGQKSISLMPFIGICLGLAVIGSTFTYVWSHTRSLKQWHKQPLAFYRMVTGHFGVGLLVLSISGNAAFKAEENLVFEIGHKHRFGDYQITLKNMYLDTGQNYYTRRGVFEVFTKDDKMLGTLHPEVRYYIAEDQNTTEADILYRWWDNLYIAMGDTEGLTQFAVRIYNQPLINGIWLACLLMAASVLLGIRRT